MEKEVGIYILVDPNTDETYIGSGILDSRRKTHLYHLENNTHPNYKLQRAFNKNPNFEFIGVPVSENQMTQEQNRDIAYDLEQSVLDDFNDSVLLLNISKDAKVSFKKLTHSDQVKQVLKEKTKTRGRFPFCVRHKSIRICDIT